nr:mannitol dehydrogenase family protein [Roseibium sp. RKSG952]
MPRIKRKQGPAPKPGIVHLGLGAFFRAHGAIFIEEAMAQSGGDWGIVGVSLQSPRMRSQLAPQGFVYNAVELQPGENTVRQIGSVCDVLVARRDPEAVLKRMSDPDIRIVSLTVTEKGYCHDPVAGGLKPDHPDIQRDLSEALPVSAPGYIVRALARRRAMGVPPFTVLSCDNLPDNGRLVRKVVLGFAERLDPELARWIGTEARFPSTMVDRIVPATQPEDIETLAARTGSYDAAPVFHEPFRQWVIEDDFVPAHGKDRRPALEAAGVQMVKDVAPYEQMKLRMLNGTHSALAYLGFLAGHETIAETVADPVFETFVKTLWQAEIIPSVSPPAGADLAAYAAVLFTRYATPAIRHRTWQIAMDGSQKLPQRILATVKDNSENGVESPRLLIAVAAWMIYVGGQDLHGRPIDVRDPLASQLKALSASGTTPDQKVAALLGLEPVFDPELAGKIKTPVAAAYEALTAQGVTRTLKDLT